MATVRTPEEMPVQRLPVYSRAETDLLHWAGKVLIPSGQMITPDVVGALLDADIHHVYLEGCKRVRPENLEEIDIFALQEDSPLPYSVFDRDGNLLAREGERLTSAQVDTLHRRGQKKIYYYKSGPGGQPSRFEAAYITRVRSRLDEQIVFGRRREKAPTGIPISRFARVLAGKPRAKHVPARAIDFYRQSVETLSKMWTALARGRYVRNNELAPLVGEFIERFLGEADLFAALAFAQPGMEVFPEHSVATAVYGLSVALQLGYNRAQARDLVAAALFHDVGYTMIPKTLLEAERSLTKGERRIIFRHIEHALLLSGRIDWPGEDFRIAIYQHRERGTGAGYPSGYRANRIHEYARILGIADVFHALVSDRPHRKARTGSEAMNMVIKMAAMRLLDSKLVRLFVRQISLYPVGATVLLSAGETARVIGASREADRPWVSVILSADGKRQTRERILDLSKLPDLFIRSETRPFEEPLAGF